MKKPKHKPEALILGYMLRYGSISRQRALTHFRVWDLPHVISRLKKTTDHTIRRKGKGEQLAYVIDDVVLKFKSDNQK